MVKGVVERCRAVLEALNVAYSWQLSGTDLQLYVYETAQHAGPEVSDAQLERMLEWYHQSHDQVEQLSDPSHPAHKEAWEAMLKQITAILRHEGLDHIVIHEIEDLVQIAGEALSRALHTFKYESSFSTWAYRVIVNRARRERRDQQATKRSAETESIDAHPQVESLLPPDTSLAQLADGKELHDIMISILQQQRDSRLLHIFQLWLDQDQGLAKIGQAVGLSSSRVSVLLEQAREILRQDPQLQAWYFPPTSDSGPKPESD